MLERPIRFVTFLAPNVLPVYQFIADYIGKQLGCSTTLTIGTSFEQFADGQADIGFICGLPYVNLTRQTPSPIELLAAPVLHGERYGGQPIYFSDVVVRHDSPFQSFADLRGRAWAYNDRDSHSGYNVVGYQLARIGETFAFFGKVVEAGWHQQSIRMVCAGAVDASAIDSQVLAIELREHPDLAAQLRVIDTLGPSTIQPVVASARLPDSIKADVRAVLIGMGDDPAARARLAHGLMERFVLVADSTYDDIRTMLNVAARLPI
jgi:phosphonate transport system substrate-binding protein